MTAALQNYGNLERGYKRLAWIYAYELTPKVCWFPYRHSWAVLLSTWVVTRKQNRWGDMIKEESLPLSSLFFSWYTGREAMKALTVLIRGLLDCPPNIQSLSILPDLPRQTIHKHQWVSCVQTYFISVFRSFIRIAFGLCPCKAVHYRILCYYYCLPVLSQKIPSTHWILVNKLFFSEKCSFLKWLIIWFLMTFCSCWLCIDYLRPSFCLSIMVRCHPWAWMLIFAGELGERNFLANGYLVKNSHPWFSWIGVLIKRGCWFCFGCIISNNIQ